MTLNEIMVIVMFMGVCGALMLGFPVAFTLAGASLIFGIIGYFFDIFSTAFFGVFPTGSSE